jgi:hypothetical protein
MRTRFNVNEIVYYIQGQRIIKAEIESFRTVDERLIYKLKNKNWSFVEKENEFNQTIIFKTIKELTKWLSKNIYDCTIKCNGTKILGTRPSFIIVDDINKD